MFLKLACGRVMSPCCQPGACGHRSSDPCSENGHTHVVPVQPFPGAWYQKQRILCSQPKHLLAPATSSLVSFCIPRPRPTTTTWPAGNDIWVLGLHLCKRWCCLEKKMCMALHLCLCLSTAVKHEMLGCWSEAKSGGSKFLSISWFFILPCICHFLARCKTKAQINEGISVHHTFPYIYLYLSGLNGFKLAFNTDTLRAATSEPWWG